MVLKKIDTTFLFDHVDRPTRVIHEYPGEPVCSHRWVSDPDDKDAQYCIECGSLIFVPLGHPSKPNLGGDIFGFGPSLFSASLVVTKCVKAKKGDQ